MATLEYRIQSGLQPVFRAVMYVAGPVSELRIREQLPLVVDSNSLSSSSYRTWSGETLCGSVALHKFQGQGSRFPWMLRRYTSYGTLMHDECNKSYCLVVNKID